MMATARGTRSILPNGTVGTRPAACIAFTQAADLPQTRAVCALVNVIVINQITVDGRVLQDVVAAVAPSQIAPTLLGLGALNRLGQYSINNGRIVFATDQPT